MAGIEGDHFGSNPRMLQLVADHIHQNLAAVIPMDHHHLRNRWAYPGKELLQLPPGMVGSQAVDIHLHNGTVLGRNH